MIRRNERWALDNTGLHTHHDPRVLIIQQIGIGYAETHHRHGRRLRRRARTYHRFTCISNVGLSPIICSVPFVLDIITYR
jgi:hypothetical protein